LPPCAAAPGFPFLRLAEPAARQSLPVGHIKLHQIFAINIKLYLFFLFIFTPDMVGRIMGSKVLFHLLRLMLSGPKCSRHSWLISTFQDENK
jgi:hypothetical protein